MFVVAALYKFATIVAPEELCAKLKDFTKEHDIFGTLLVASEGINGTVAGSRASIDRLKAYLLNDGRFADMEYKESFASTNPFCRMKVKLKKEIVTLGKPEAKPSEIVGTYVSAEQWNILLADPEVMVIDVRNNYEVEIGTFKGAINPKTESFREFPNFVENLELNKETKIAMMCTGGIRCEKASSYMKHIGFSEVYHLKGGILQYLEDIRPEQSQWEGECFVFDNRVSVDHELKVGSYDLCHGCRLPICEADKLSPHFVKGVTCPRCFDKRSEEQKASAKSRQKQIDLAKAQGRKHLGPKL